MHLGSLALVAVAMTATLVGVVFGDDSGQQFGPGDIDEVYGFGSNTTTAPNVEPAKQLKKGLIAGGYIPFVILIVVSYLTFCKAHSL